MPTLFNKNTAKVTRRKKAVNLVNWSRNEAAEYAGMSPSTLKDRVMAAVAFPHLYPTVKNPNHFLAASVNINIAGEMQFYAPTFKLWADEYVTRPEVIEARRLGAEFPTQEVVQTYKDANELSIRDGQNIITFCRQLVEKKGGRVHIRVEHSV